MLVGYYCKFVAFLYTDCNMTTFEGRYLTKLKNSGHSNTVARRAVFGVLNSRPHARLTAPHIIAETEGKADRASVYRAIQLFEDLGIIKRISSGFKNLYELSDDFYDHHHHLTCNNCGKEIILEGAQSLEKQINELAKAKDFIILDHSLELTGICKICRN